MNISTNSKNTDQRFYIEEALPKRYRFSKITTFSAYAAIWIEDAKSRLAPKTYKRYEALLKIIDKGIGHIRLQKLSPIHLQLFYRKLSQEGANRITGRGLAPKTVLHHHRLISVVLHQATIDRLIPYNVSDKNFMHPPKFEASEAVFLEESDVNAMLKCLSLEPPKWSFAVHLLLLTGMRRGELLGLEWKDIDIDNGIINVVRSSQYVPQMGTITKSPKNSTSCRIVKLPKGAIDTLKSYREWWEFQRANADNWNERINITRADGGQSIQQNDRLFITANGLPMNPDSLTDWVSKFVIRHGLPKFSPHSLRHTHASLLIKHGMDIASVSKRLGHANSSITLKIYTHSFEAANITASEIVDTMFDFH